MSLLLIVGLVGLVVGAWPSQSAAQVTTLKNLFLQEYGLYYRTGSWNIYSFPGSPFGFPIGAGFGVGQVCQSSGFGGAFLSAGQGFGDLAFVSAWPFSLGTTLGSDTSGNPLDLCDPNADEAWWFLYGNSLNNLPGGVTGGISRFFGNDDTIVSNFCSTQKTPTEGIFFFARRSAPRQQFDTFCNSATNGQQPLRAGNVLICRFPRGATWVTPAGVPTGIHTQPLFGLEFCEWYATCSDSPIGGVVSNASCAAGGGGSGGGGTGTVVVTVLNGNNSNPVSGASVSFPGGPTLTTNSSGQATFTGVPAGASITFTATASGFGSGSGAVTPTAGQTTQLTIKLPVVVTCSDFSHDGGDTGDTQIVELAKTPATFKFDWDTYSVKDRVVVSHDGATLFDSGCVGASGSETLRYSGGSTQVKVQVFPNCAGDSGTGWTYTVHCPSP